MTPMLRDTEKIFPEAKMKNKTKVQKPEAADNEIISCSSLSRIIILVFLCTSEFNYQ